MATSPPPFNPFSGQAPQRGDKSTFSQRFDAFITWFIAAVVQLAALAANVYANAVEAFQSAGTASNAAAAAMVTANAYPWASGVTVPQYAAVISTVDGRTYRRIAATGSGTTDPSIDTANYVLLSALPVPLQLLASATVSSPVSTLNLLNIFSSQYDRYQIELIDFQASASAQLCLRLAAGGVAIQGGYTIVIGHSGQSLSPTQSSLVIASTPLLSGGGGGSFTIDVRNANSSRLKIVDVRGAYQDSPQGYYTSVFGTAVNINAGILTGLQVFFASGNIVGGTIRVYGMKNA